MNKLTKNKKALSSISCILSWALFFNMVVPAYAVTIDLEKMVQEGHWEGGYFDSNSWLDQRVSTQSGGHRFSEERIYVPCPGISLELNLTYKNQSEHPDCGLGASWTHSYEWVLLNHEAGKALHTGSGRQIIFESVSGGYKALGGSNWFIDSTTSGYDLIIPGGLHYEFNTSGRLETIQDAWGNTIQCNYDSNECLESVQHDNGRQLVFSNTWETAVQDWRIATLSVSNGPSLAFEYGTAGEITQVVETVGAQNFTSAYFYANGQLTNRIDAAGNSMAYTVDSSSEPKTTSISVNEKREHSINYVSDSITEVASSMRGVDQHFRYAYNSSGLLTEKYGPAELLANVQMRGNRYVYDANETDLLENTLFGDGETWSQWMQYDDLHRMTNYAVSYCSTNPSRQVSIEYEPTWNLESAYESADGGRTEITYTNASMNVVKAFYTPSNSHDTVLSYTTNGLLQTITNANGSVVELGYNAEGDLTTIVPELGPSLTNSYNTLGYISRMDMLAEDGSATGRFIAFERDVHGRATQEIFPNGTTNHYAFNGLGQLTNHIDCAGNVTEYTLNADGQQTSITQYLKQGGSNIPVRIAYEMDEQANILRISEPRGRYVESYQFDVQDRLVAITNIEDQVMSIDYGVGNFVNEITRFDETRITNTYNNAGRKSSVTYLSSAGAPLSTNLFDYYADGELKSLSNGTHSISYEYDGLNQSKEIYTETPARWARSTYSRDSMGNVTNMAVHSADINDGHQVIYSTYFNRDSLGRRESQEDFVYSYNQTNGLTSVISNEINGVTCSYAYNIMDQIESITYRNASNDIIQSVGYAYNELGMITNKTQNLRGAETQTHYQYDSLNRLVGENRIVGQTLLSSQSYAYDLAGNRTVKQTASAEVAFSTIGVGNRFEGWSASIPSGQLCRPVSGISSEPIGTDYRWGELWLSNTVTQTATFPGISGSSFYADQLPFASGDQSIVAAIRDQAGNMGYATNTVNCSLVTNALYAYNAAGCTTNISHQGFDGYTRSLSLDWNERYQLTSAAQDDTTIDYEYDSLGRKVARTRTVDGSPATVEHYVYDGDHVIMDLDSNCWPTRSYVYGEGIDNILTMKVHDSSLNVIESYSYLKDHQNTVLAIADSEGNIVESYEYDAWGRVLSVKDENGQEIVSAEGFPTSGIGNRFTFQGREIDWDTGLYHFRARWYNPVSGRWLSKDPIGIAGGLNQYVFCANNPVNFADPMGELSLDLDRLMESSLPWTIGLGILAIPFGVPGAIGALVIGGIMGVSEFVIINESDDENT